MTETDRLQCLLYRAYLRRIGKPYEPTECLPLSALRAHGSQPARSALALVRRDARQAVPPASGSLKEAAHD